MISLSSQRIFPLAVPADAEQTDALGAGLIEGGLGAVEVGLRGDYALEAVRRLARRADGLLVGAGTIRTPGDVNAAHAAGASFLVSPGLSEPVVARAAELGLPLIPGVATASEIMRACDLGLTLLKLFPANLVGGLQALDAFSVVFPDVRFVPSGGVSQSNLAQFLGHPAVHAVSGSWITSPVLLDGGAAAVAEAASLAATTVRQVTGV